jgi:murein DD-endopeptidase MepM/ murein hydrolase activator NlpD
VSKVGGRAWTLVFVRGSDTETHSVRLRARTWLTGGLVVVVLVLTAGGGLGVLWQQTRESTRTTELTSDVARLSLERTQMVELATRLERMEVDYRRLQKALGQSASGEEGGIWLPPLEPSLGEPGVGAAGRTLYWPLAQRGYITRSHRRDADESHMGLDIAVPAGSYVRASAGGLVADVGSDTTYGRFVRLEHADGLSTLYGHNAWTFVSAGDSVDALEVIALSGSTGQSTGPHLHFETRREGQRIDPLELLGP